MIFNHPSGSGVKIENHFRNICNEEIKLLNFDGGIEKDLKCEL